jgi:molybdopterin-guanine dinucleotide biosynthesis protein A
LETGEEIPVVPDSLADQYRKLMREHIDALTTKFSEARIDYVLLNTSRPLDDALFHYLGNRERLMRVR